MGAIDNLTSFLAGETNPHKFDDAVRMRIGKVISVATGTITVQIGADTSTSIPGVAYLGGAPPINKPVVLLQQGANTLVALGVPASQVTNNTPLTDVAYLSLPNTFTQLNTFTLGLVVSGGTFNVDSSGRVGLGGSAVVATELLSIGNAFTHPSSATQVFGAVAAVRLPSTTTSLMASFDSSPYMTAAAYTTTDVIGFRAEQVSNITGGAAVTNSTGFRALNQGQTGVTNAYGVFVSAQSGAATLNVGARIDSGTTVALWLSGDVAATDATKGIMFGSARDTKLYRSSTSTLRTDGEYDVFETSAHGGVRISNETSGPWHLLLLRTDVASSQITLWNQGTYFGVFNNPGRSIFAVDQQGRASFGDSVVPNTAYLISVSAGAAHPSSATSIYGIVQDHTAPSTATSTSTGMYSRIHTAAAAFTLSTGYAFRADNPTLGAASVITNLYGHQSENQGVSGVTNAYGFYGVATAGAATLNVTARFDTGTTCALWLGGDTTATDATGGIAFGSGRDVTIYRSAASTLSLNGGLAVDTSGRAVVNAGSVNTAVLLHFGGAGATHPGSATTLYAALANFKWPSTTTVSGFSYYGVTQTAAASFTMVTGAVFYADVPVIGAASAITNQLGVRVLNQGASGITNAYGVNIAATSGAATLNVSGRFDTGTTCALWLGGETTATDVTGGIAFGSGRDVTLFRGAAGQLASQSLFLTATQATPDIFHTTVNGGSQPGAGIDRNNHFYAANINYQKRATVESNYNATTTTVSGSHSTLNTSGTAAALISAPWSMIQYTSGAVSGNTGGWLASAAYTERDFNFDWSGVCRIGGVITTVRWWIGLASADLSGVGTPTTQHVAAFRYDTGVDTANGNFRAVTCDGASNVTTTDTGVAVVGATNFRFRIVTDTTNAAIRFFINDQLVATHSTNLPGATTGLLDQMQVTTLTTAGRIISNTQMLCYTG